MAYFLITSGEDGLTVERLTETELLERIEPDENGDSYYGEALEFLSKMPDVESGCFVGVEDNAVVLIKGEIIVPKATKVATKYKL